MKKLAVIFIVLITFLSIACTKSPIFDASDSRPVTGAITMGFPSDFPVLQDTGGLGSGTTLTGFGGNLSLDQAGNRAAVTRNPVILLHGNGGSANSATWGWETFRNFLKAAGYNDSEIWAVSYLGENNSSADMSDPHRNNIEDVRRFIDAVIAYLGVTKVDIIGHSLGCGMARSYMLGLQTDGTWDNSKNRLDVVGTLVTLAGANYGLGPYSMSEFKTGSSWEINSHKYNGVTDDTPRGASSTAQMTSPVSNWKAATGLDNNTITYVAFTAVNDFVDQQNTDTGRLVGANLNKRYNLGSSTTGHEEIIKNQTVFNDLLPYLNTQQGQPLEEPPVVSINPNGGTFYEGQTVSVQISATNDPSSVEYRIDGGTWTAYSSAITVSNTCTIEAKAANQYGTSQVVSATFTKSQLPPYEQVTATATEHYNAGRIDVTGYTTYGMKYGYSTPFTLYRLEGETTWTDVEPSGGGTDPEPGEVPVVSISPNGGTFTDTQQVTISATNDPTSIQYRINSGTWTTYSGAFTISETSTIEAKASNSTGESQIVSTVFTKETTPPPSDVLTENATASGHYVAGRLNYSEYLAMGSKYGYMDTFNLYSTDNGQTWTDVAPN